MSDTKTPTVRMRAVRRTVRQLRGGLIIAALTGVGMVLFYLGINEIIVVPFDTFLLMMQILGGLLVLTVATLGVMYFAGRYRANRDALEKAAETAPDGDANDMSVREVMRRILAHAVDKEFRKKAYPVDRDIAHIHREISEAFEAYRRCPEDADWKAITEDGGKPEGVTVEMADALMRICEFCAYYELPLVEAIRRKLAYLATRPALHGKRF